MIPHKVHNLLNLLERMARGEAVDLDDAELGEAILVGGANRDTAKALLTFSNNPDKAGAWERFTESGRRTYGLDWRNRLIYIAPRLCMDKALVFACTQPGCSELCWWRVCDRCLVRML